MDQSQDNLNFLGQDDNAGTSASWAQSYSDVVSLLLVFFIIINVTSKTQEDQGKDNSGERERQEKISQIELQLNREITQQKIAHNVKVKNNQDSLSLILKDKSLFVSGSARLSRKKITKLSGLLKILARLPKYYYFAVEGHTDDVPIKTRKIQSNWHLSALRAVTIVNLLKKVGIRAKNIWLEAYASHRSVKPNRDKQGRGIEKNRSQNRRVVIRIEYPQGQNTQTRPHP